MSHTTNGTPVQVAREETIDRLSERVALTNELLGAALILLVAVILLAIVKTNAPF